LHCNVIEFMKSALRHEDTKKKIQLFSFLSFVAL